MVAAEKKRDAYCCVGLGEVGVALKLCRYGGILD